MKQKKLDAHAHIYPAAIADKACANLEKFYQITVHSKGTYEDLCNQLDQNGFCGMFFLCVATNPHQVPKVNDTIAHATAQARQNGFEAYGFMGMHQDYSAMADEVERCAAMGLTGVKIHPDIQAVDIDDRRLYPLYESIEGKMPLFLHMGDAREQYQYSKAQKLVHVLKDFPKLKVLAAHLGSYADWDNAACLYGHENVWYDLSSSLWALTPERAVELIEKCGYDRVLFGTDYPIYHIRDYDALFARLPLSEKQREDIYYHNAMRFLRA